jgi:hypothetical protein
VKRNIGNQAVYGCKAICHKRLVTIAGFPQYCNGRWYIDIYDGNILTTAYLEEIIMPDGLNKFIPVLNKQSTRISEIGYIDTLQTMLSENDEKQEQSK